MADTQDTLADEALSLSRQVALSEFNAFRGMVETKAPSEAVVSQAILAFIVAGRRKEAGGITENHVDATRLGFLAGGFQLLENEVANGRERPPISIELLRMRARVWLSSRAEDCRTKELNLMGEHLGITPLTQG
jgi:hypothetical protein